MGRDRTRPQARQASLADALFTKVQQRVLGVLFGNPARSFYANEVIRLAHAGTGAVQRELVRLESAGLVNSRRVGKQKHYQANPKAPIFEDLRALVMKTSGLSDVLLAALAPHSADITAAFIFGSVAKREDTAHSDIDMLVVSSSLTYGDLFSVLEPAVAQLGRKIAPAIYTPDEFSKLVSEKNAFITRVMSQPKIWLIGGKNDLAA